MSAVLLMAKTGEQKSNVFITAFSGVTRIHTCIIHTRDDTRASWRSKMPTDRLMSYVRHVQDPKNPQNLLITSSGRGAAYPRTTSRLISGWIALRYPQRSWRINFSEMKQWCIIFLVIIYNSPIYTRFCPLTDQAAVRAWASHRLFFFQFLITLL